MLVVVAICWFTILLLIWIGKIRNKLVLCFSIIVSLIPIVLNLFKISQIGNSLISDYLFISPILLLTSHFLLNLTYKYLYGMESDPGIPYTNRAKFSNRKLNIGDYIVSICPLLISLLPVLIKY